MNHQRLYRRWLYMLVPLLLLVGALPAIPGLSTVAQAQDGSRSGPLCFAETGECIAGAIRIYWEDNGGLPVFGYPITPLQIEAIDGWEGPTQWFERDRLEDHGAQGVLAGRLGALLLELQGRPWDVAFPQILPASVPPTCAYFPETRHSLCDPFLRYWRNNGGVQRFGYPITEPFQETIGTWTGTVQYFERRRMELHSELPGSPVLLGLLGNEILDGERPDGPTTPGGEVTPPDPDAPIPQCVETLLPRRDANTTRLRNAYEQLDFRVHLGCPFAYIYDVPTSVQRFERGEMLWLDMSRVGGVPITLAGRFIYSVFYPGPTYGRYADTWNAGVDPYIYAIEPPTSGLYMPVGGFGKLWINDSNVRNALGWAVEELPTEGQADVVVFDNIYNDPGNLGVMVLVKETGTVYAFGRLDMPDEVAVQY